MMKMKREKESAIMAAIQQLSFPHHPELVINPAAANRQGEEAVHAATAHAPASCGGAGDHSLRLRQVSNIPTKPLLALCHSILQVLDKIGPTMAVLRQDMFHNIQRLELRMDSHPTMYSNVIEIVKKEAAEGTAKKSDSCSRALLWLTRSLDFMVALLERIARGPDHQRMEQMVEESYNLTLKPWHGWISSAAYKVALKLLPDNKTFIELLGFKGQNISSLHEEINSLITLLAPLLDDIHFVLGMHGLDRLKCT